MVLYTNGYNVSSLHQRFLWVTCNITGLTSCYAYSIGAPAIVSYPLYAVWVASNLYWCHPTNGWRKQLDMLVAHIGIPFLSIGAIVYKPPYWRITSMGVTGCAVLFRAISMHYYDQLIQIHDKEDAMEKEGVYVCSFKNACAWKSTLAHSAIHLFSNLFSAWLAYSYIM